MSYSGKSVTKSKTAAKPARKSLKGLLTVAAAASAGILGIAGTARAANTVSTWTGPSGTTTTPLTGFWSATGNWSGGLPASGATTELDFGGSTSTAYTATNNISTGSFNLNEIQLNSTASATEVIAANTSANTLTFVANAGVTPTILQNNTGAFSISAGVVLGNNLTLGGNGSGNLTMSGVLSGSGLLTTNEANNTISLSATNTYTGGTNVSSGILDFTKAASMPTTGNINVLSGGTLAIGVGGAGYFSNATSGANSIGGVLSSSSISFASGSSIGIDTTAGNLTYAGNITAAIGLTKLGANNLLLTGTNTYSGATTVIAGLVDFTTLAALPSGSAITVKGGTLAIGVGGTGYFSNATSGSGSIGGVLSSTTFASGSAFGIDTTNASASIAYTGSITGSEGLTKLGTGALVLSGPNTYTGATTVVNGTLSYTGAASSGIAGSNGSLDVGNTSGNIAVMNINTSGTLYFGNTTNVTVGEAGASGVINQTSGTFVYLNGIANYLTVGNGGYGAYQLSGGTLQSASGGIRLGGGSATGVGVFTQTSGTVAPGRYFSIGTAGVGVATFTGGTFNGSGSYRTLVSDSTNATGVLNIGTEAGGNASFSTGGNGGLQLVQTSGSGTLNLNSGTLIFTAPGNGSTNSGIYRTNGTGVVNLNGGVIQTSVTGQTLVDNTPTSVNDYNGGVTFNIADGSTISDTVSANILATANNGLYPSGGVLSIASGGGSGYVGAPVVTVSGGGGTGATAVANVVGGVITGVTITSPGQGYTAGSTISFAFNGGGSTNVAPTYNYVIGAADPNLTTNATGGLTKIGPGILVLSGTSTYLGTTAINGGILNLGSGNGASSGPLGNGGPITFGGGSLQYGAANQYDYSPRFSTNANQAVSIDTNGQNISFATGLNSSGGSLTKLGAGNLTLNASSSYSGATNINVGKLILGPSASLNNTTTVTITSGATLNPKTGSGSLTIGSGSANVIVKAGGTLDMTDGAIGTLNVVNSAGGTGLTLGALAGATSNLTFELNSSAADQINITGGVSVPGTAAITIVPLNVSSLVPGQYPLITSTGGGLGSGFSLATSFFQSGTSNFVLSLANSTSNAEMLTVSQVNGSLANAYWAGTIDSNWSTNNSGFTNWQTSSGTETGALPDATTNVYFTASAPNFGNLNTTLVANQSINSLTFNGNAAAPIGISGYTLSIGAYPLNGNPSGNGINVTAGSAANPITINSNVSIGSNQTWTNNASSPLIVTGSIVGPASLTQAGSGPLTLAGSNTFTGGLTASSGTLNLNNPSALGAGLFTIAGSVTLDNTTGGPITLGTANPQSWNADFAFNGK